MESLIDLNQYLDLEYSAEAKAASAATLAPLKVLARMLERDLMIAVQIGDFTRAAFIAHFYGQVSSLLTEIEGYVLIDG